MSRKSGTLANENAQSILRHREKDILSRRKSDLLAVLATPAGRRFVWDAIEDAGTYGPSYSGEALATAFNEGRRSVGIGLLTRAQSDATDLYVQMLQEQLAERKLDVTTRAVAQATPDEENHDG